MHVLLTFQGAGKCVLGSQAAASKESRCLMRADSEVFLSECFDS